MTVSLRPKLTSFLYASTGEAPCRTLALTMAQTQAHSLDLTTGSSQQKFCYVLQFEEKNKSKVGFDIGKLQDKEVQQALNLELTNRFDALSSDEHLTPDKSLETFKTVMTETADEILGQAKIKRQHWITARTLSIVGE